MEILRQKKVTTRKPHKCWGCTHEFIKGTSMEYVVHVERRELTASYWCIDCQKILSEMDAYDKDQGFCFGELTENYRESIIYNLIKK